MRILVIGIMISCLAIISCNNEPKQVTMSDIKELEDELFNSSMSIPNPEKAQTLVNMYIDYANNNPQDTISPNLLFKAADISMNFRAPVKSIALFNRIINEYPDYKNVHTAMFLKGFVYEDQLKDFSNARKSYMEFLDRYPNSDFADDARVSLQHLGKSPEELIKEFENNN